MSDNPQNGMEISVTGIPGLDEMFEHKGIPEGNMVLLSGACGTGKSIFGMQFLYYGAMNGESGVYVSLEEPVERVIKNMEGFGWDVRKLIDEGKLVITRPEIYELEALKRSIFDSVEQIGAKRLVIDSFTLISTYLKDTYDVRKTMFDVGHEIKKLKCTTLLISDMIEKSSTFSVSGFEEFIADGVIVLYLVQDQSRNYLLRTLLIRKMRGTKHSLKYIPMRIQDDKGIVLFPDAAVFEEM
jgi:circadian clock protein KaiC